MTVRRLTTFLVLLGACTSRDSAPDARGPAATAPLASIQGLSGPEAVRYDADQDVYFVANFDGAPEGDANGFITRARPDGTVDSLRYMVGTTTAPLHGPRGMFITGDTLWAADALGVHGFNRRTGAHVAFVDFTSFEPGFLNDIAQGPDGALYVTDTGKSRVYRLAGRAVTIAVESPSPNGITWDSAGARFLLASWTEGPSVRSWVPGGTSTETVGAFGQGRFDGIELVGGRILVASQNDSSIQSVTGTGRRAILQVAGDPADIGIDTRRNRVAVPYISLNRVDIWEIRE